MEGVAEGGQEREAISACFPAASVPAGSAADFYFRAKLWKSMDYGCQMPEGVQQIFLSRTFVNIALRVQKSMAS